MINRKEPEQNPATNNRERKAEGNMVMVTVQQLEQFHRTMERQDVLYRVIQRDMAVYGADTCIQCSMLLAILGKENNPEQIKKP